MNCTVFGAERTGGHLRLGEMWVRRWWVWGSGWESGWSRNGGFKPGIGEMCGWGGQEGCGGMVAAIHGKDLTIPKGTEVMAFVAGDMHLEMAKFAPTEGPGGGAGASLAMSPNVTGGGY